MTDTPDGLEFEMRIREGRTILEFGVNSDVAVIVTSASGEEIYLPREDSGSTGDGPPSSYQPSSDSDSDGPASSYTASWTSEDDEGPVVGWDRTPKGDRIVHPEPVTDIRVLTST